MKDVKTWNMSECKSSTCDVEFNTKCRDDFMIIPKMDNIFEKNWTQAFNSRFINVPKIKTRLFVYLKMATV